jgi:hypothetical protein
MFLDTFRYPSAWTKDMQHYHNNKQKVIDRIVDMMENYPKYRTEIQRQKKKLQTEYFNGQNLYETIDESI